MVCCGCHSGTWLYDGGRECWYMVDVRSLIADRVETRRAWPRQWSQFVQSDTLVACESTESETREIAGWYIPGVCSTRVGNGVLWLLVSMKRGKRQEDARNELKPDGALTPELSLCSERAGTYRCVPLH